MKRVIKIRSFLPIAFLLQFGLHTTAYSQEFKGQKKVDSLITILISLDDPIQKVDILNLISDSYVRTDYRLALEYGQQALSLAEESDYRMGIFKASKNISHIYTSYYLNYYEGLNHLSRALEIAEEMHDSELLMNTYQSFGFLKSSMGDKSAGIAYFQKAIRIAQQLDDYSALATLYTYVADQYFEQGDLINAADYYGKVNSLYELSKIDGTNVSLFLALGMHHRLAGEYDEAEAIYKEAISNYSNVDRPRFESYAYSQLSRVYTLSGDYFSAVNASNEGLAIANAKNLTKEKMDNYLAQIAVYDSLGDYKKTYSTLIKYTTFKDSLNSSQISEQNRKFQTNYEEIVSKNQIIQYEKEQQNNKLALKNEQLSRDIIIGILVFVVVIVILMILRLRFIRRKEKELRVLSLATSHSTNSIVIFDNEIKVEWVNKGFENLTGLTLEDVKGKYFLEFYNGPQLKDEKKSELEYNFSKGSAFSMELSSTHRSSNRNYWISISVTPLFDSNNEIMSYVSVATDITDIHETQVELQHLHDQTILLNEIGKQITSSLSVIDIIEKVYENVNKLMDAQNLGIGIYREAENDLYFPGPIENGKQLNSFSYSLTNRDRIATKAFSENREIIVGTAEERNAVTGSNPSPLEGGQPNSIVYLPLISKWKVIGVISVQSMAEHAYGAQEINIVRTLATFVAIGLENAGLYETMEEKVEERTHEVTLQKEELQKNYDNTKLLSELGIQISSSLEIEDIFESLYSSVTKLMDAEIFGIRLYHEDIQQIEYKFEMESGTRDEVIWVSMEDKDNYSVWTVENDKEILLNDNKNEYQNFVSEIKVPSGEMPNSLIFCPMHGDGKVIGVLTVQSFKLNAYSTYEVDMVKTLASYASSALNNANLYDTLEQKVEERTIELAEKNKDIMASINYAKRIQNGILPSRSFMEQLWPESFVFYQPRDVVSGDFYWVDRAPGKIFFAVVDCTGHGVPGALMSIIGKNILDQALNEKALTEPSMILAFLRAGLRFAFGSGEEDESIQVEDGMDLGICVYHTEDNYIEFAGANSHLHIIRNGELILIKGNKSGVSASDFTLKHFENHEFHVQKGDKLYLTSDGYPDQFGGDRSKKFSQRRFQELLIQLDRVPFDQHENEFEAVFTEWKGDRGQLDDVCVMGVKI